MHLKMTHFFLTQQIISHENYSNAEKKNDIALIRLLKEIPISSHIRPACLETSLQDLSEDLELDVAGWGSTSAERKINTNFRK